MTEFISDHALLLVFGLTGLSCLGLPIPASAVIVTAGALAAGSAPGPVSLFLAAYLAAVAAGVAVFALGRSGGARLVDRLAARPSLSSLVERSRDVIQRRGAAALLLCSSLIAQLGPMVMLLAGSSRVPWRLFVLSVFSGRLLYVAGYMLLGMVFSEQILGLLGATGGD